MVKRVKKNLINPRTILQEVKLALSLKLQCCRLKVCEVVCEHTGNQTPLLEPCGSAVSIATAK